MSNPYPPAPGQAAPPPSIMAMLNGVDPSKASGARATWLNDCLGTYWLQIQIMKMAPNPKTGMTRATIIFTVAKVIAIPASGEHFKEGAELTLNIERRQDITKDYFDSEISALAWGLMKNDFIASGKAMNPPQEWDEVKKLPASVKHPQTGQWLESPMQQALAFAFGADAKNPQPFLNVVVEVKNYGQPAGAKSATPGKIFIKSQFNDIVPRNILATELSETALTKFPVGHFAPADLARRTPGAVQSAPAQAQAQAAPAFVQQPQAAAPTFPLPGAQQTVQQPAWAMGAAAAPVQQAAPQPPPAPPAPVWNGSTWVQPAWNGSAWVFPA